MKKLLPLLFLFLSFINYAQVQPGMQLPYNICDDASNDGFAVFNLTSRIPSILSGVDASEHEVHFYSSETDAANGTNEITTPNAYNNSSQGTQVIGIKIVNTTTNIIVFSGMNLVVNPLPTAIISGSATVCQNSVNPAITITGSGGTTLYTFIYSYNGVTQTVSTIGGNSVTISPSSTAILTSIYSLISVQSSGIQGCSQNISGSAVITVNPQPNAGSDGNATVCNISSTAIDLYNLITGEQADGTWTRTSGTGGTFNAVAGTYSPAIGATTSSFTYTISGTAPCLDDTSLVTIVVNDCTGQPVCGGNFTDQGGITANYPNNSNSTTTICPNNPGEAVTVTFTSFKTEATSDALYVYNGANVGISQISSGNSAGNVPGGLAGGYWGNTIPGPFTSTSQNGCLTFVFRSDGSNTLEGWNSNVICSSVPCNPPTDITVTNLNGTSAILNWNNPSNSNAWEILILPEGSPLPAPSAFGTYVQSLPYTVTGLTPDFCYTAYVRSLCSSSSEWSVPVGFCMVNCENNGDCAESLSLIAFFDNNNNGVKDSDETNFSYGNFVYQVNDSGNNLYGNSNSGSYYIFDSNSNNSYDINFVVNSELTSYYTSSVSHNNVTLPTGSGANTLYFPIVNTQPHVNATVSLNPSGQPRPGFTYVVSILYQNFGSQTIPSGTLTFTKDPNVTITDISQSGIVATTNGFTYDFTGLTPLESRFIYLTLLVPPIPTVNLGDLITNNVTIQISNDIDLSNNSSSLNQTVVGSYDPNDKMESHGGKILHADFTANDYLYYTIQFENTGTASAEFIRVEDVLDAKLDQTTFEMISASHNVNTKRNDNQLIWHFYNINLPPTVTNPTGSHGYVYFKIKPKAGYAVGDIIPNTASIYFDYNPAIITNTFNTQFVQALSTTTFDSNAISLHPNPASTNFIINTTGLVKITKIAIYDVSGKKIFTMNENKLDTIAIDVSSFAKGIYLVEITSEDHQKLTKKLIIQ